MALAGPPDYTRVPTHLFGLPLPQGMVAQLQAMYARGRAPGRSHTVWTDQTWDTQASLATGDPIQVGQWLDSVLQYRQLNTVITSNTTWQKPPYSAAFFEQALTSIGFHKVEQKDFPDLYMTVSVYQREKQ
jgi:hypothetical protein